MRTPYSDAWEKPFTKIYTPDGVMCAECRHKLSNKDNYCSNCGNQIDRGQKPEYTCKDCERCSEFFGVVICEGETLGESKRTRLDMPACNEFVLTKEYTRLRKELDGKGCDSYKGHICKECDWFNSRIHHCSNPQHTQGVTICNTSPDNKACSLFKICMKYEDPVG